MLALRPAKKPLPQKHHQHLQQFTRERNLTPIPSKRGALKLSPRSRTIRSSIPTADASQTPVKPDQEWRSIVTEVLTNCGTACTTQTAQTTLLS